MNWTAHNVQSAWNTTQRCISGADRCFFPHHVNRFLMEFYDAFVEPISFTSLDMCNKAYVLFWVFFLTLLYWWYDGKKKLEVMEGEKELFRRRLNEVRSEKNALASKLYGSKITDDDSEDKYQSSIFRALNEDITNYLLIHVSSALKFASVAHRTQKRKDANAFPYINHPIEVANKIAQSVHRQSSSFFYNVYAAALLHDTVEDTHVTLDDIERNFGSTIAHIVKEVTEDKSLPKSQRKRFQLQCARTMSLGAQMVKLADKWSNCKDLCESLPRTFSVRRAQQYFAWSRAIAKKMPDSPALYFLKQCLFDVTNGTFSVSVEKDGEKEVREYACVPVSDNDLLEYVEKYFTELEAEEKKEKETQNNKQ